MVKPDLSTLEVGPRDIIVLRLVDLDDDATDDLIKALHSRFPGNMVLFLGVGEEIEARSEEEVKELLKAIEDHQEYREHKALTEGPS